MARSRTSSAGELLVELRRDDSVPLHRQLEQELRGAIRSGRLAAAAVLPSTRALAEQLGVSRGVVVEAYEQLVAEGYLSSQPGGTTRVCANVSESPLTSKARPTSPVYRIDFGYGRPDVSQFPRQAWLRSLRRVLNEAPSERLSYLEPRGAPELCEALATYLNRVRGTAANPDRIVICNGFAQALSLVTHVLAANGGMRIAVEDPGQRDAIRAAGRSGLDVVPIPVDDDGIVVETLRRLDPDAVILTPAHHFPTGAVLSPERRAALVSWATQRDRLILEDDYDAEYRYDREPIGALQGLAPEHVIYAGSASKTLAPGLRLGWLIAPPRLVDQIAATKEAIDRGSASLEQLAFADFLSRGEFDHHLRRMRPIYRARRDTLLTALGRDLPELRPGGASAGLHVQAWQPAAVDEAALVECAAEVGVGVDGVTPYRSTARDGPGGLLFGYGSATESVIEEGVRLIAGVLDRARTSAAVSRVRPHGRPPQRLTTSPGETNKPVPENAKAVGEPG
jgi:GntR family transcriptional regulator/MocR family aminotransferase